MKADQKLKQTSCPGVYEKEWRDDGLGIQGRTSLYLSLYADDCLTLISFSN